jgi:hypothetical protein
MARELKCVLVESVVFINRQDTRWRIQSLVIEVGLGIVCVPTSSVIGHTMCRITAHHFHDTS